MRRKLFELKAANEDDTDSTEVPDNRGKPHLHNKNDAHSNERFFMTVLTGYNFMVTHRLCFISAMYIHGGTLMHSYLHV